jgi:hypothetical protein
MLTQLCKTIMTHCMESLLTWSLWYTGLAPRGNFWQSQGCQRPMRALPSIFRQFQGPALTGDPAESKSAASPNAFPTANV